MYKGTIVPLVTPINDHGEVSPGCVDRLIDYIHPQVTGLMPALSTGEGWKLSEGQWRAIVTCTKRSSRGLPVLAGIQLPKTADIVSRAEMAVEIGVDAVVVAPPHGVESQREIYEHYQRLSAEIPLPLFIYNEEGISGGRTELDTLLRVLSLPGVAGVKESSASPEFTRAVIAAETGVPVFAGWENLLLDSPGVAGFIGPLANLQPALCNDMLANPSPERQQQVNAACESYGLFADDWYRHAKKELHRRGIIESDQPINGEAHDNEA